jgi:hypothetical protein
MEDSRQIPIHSVCPNGHTVTQLRTVADLRRELETTNDVKYHCNRCDSMWSPGESEISKMRTLIDS